MRTAYRVLAGLVALGVVVQAGAIAFAVSGLGIWVNDGGVFDKAAFESGDLDFTGIAGFMVHGMNGMMVIPLLALLLLIVSFFAKVPRGIVAAAAVLVLVVLQVTLGLMGHSTPYAGMLHGVNALILLGTALYAAGLAKDRAVHNTSERMSAGV